jgi:hypothetical protein
MLLAAVHKLHLLVAANEMTITVELLDALLSSGPSRQQAEAHFESQSLLERIQGLLNVLFSPDIQERHLHLATVLLRRDISNLGMQRTSPELLQKMVEPLLQLFEKLSSASCRRQVGYCLAEVCNSLSLSHEGQAVVETVLTTSIPKVRCVLNALLRCRYDIFLLTCTILLPVPRCRSRIASTIGQLGRSSSQHYGQDKLDGHFPVCHIHS